MKEIVWIRAIIFAGLVTIVTLSPTVDSSRQFRDVDSTSVTPGRLARISETFGSARRLEVIRVEPKNPEQLLILQDMRRSDAFLDFWTQPRTVGSPVDIMVGTRTSRMLMRHLESHKIPHKIVVEDVDSFLLSVEQEERARSGRTSVRYFSGRNFGFDDYHDTATIYEQLNTWQSRYGRHRAAVSVLGRTVEDKEIKMVYLSNGQESQNGTVGDGRSESHGKPLIVVNAGMHAREWIGPATVMYIAQEILGSLDSEQKSTDNRLPDPAEGNRRQRQISTAFAPLLLDHFDFAIIPVLNPDGYDFSFDAHVPPWMRFIRSVFARNRNRLWRKNRALNNGICMGVDINRNFDFAWNPSEEHGASGQVCDGTYAGPHAFSEPETRALSDFLRRNRNRTAAFLDVHSFGRAILLPWAHTRETPADYDALLEAGKAMRDAIARTAQLENRRSDYVVDSTAKTLYLGSGVGVDYSYGALNISNSYTIELPSIYDGVDYHFLLPARYIKEVGRETAAGVAALVEHLRTRK